MGWTSLLLGIRGRILERDRMESIATPLVNFYRRAVFHLGPNTYSLELSTGESAVFKAETMEEIRHFYPVYGELTELEDLVGELESGDVFYDVGSHVGIFSLIASSRIDGEQVFAFEPHPRNVERMEENFRLNGAQSITVFDVALSDRNAPGEISVDSRRPGAIGHSDSTRRSETYDVEYRRGDDVVSEEDLPEPTILKIDVEGAELEVLAGLSDSLDGCRICYVEVSDDLADFGNSRQELFDFFQARDFDREPIGARTDERGNFKFYRD